MQAKSSDKRAGLTGCNFAPRQIVAWGIAGGITREQWMDEFAAFSSLDRPQGPRDWANRQVSTPSGTTVATQPFIADRATAEFIR